MSDTVQVNRQDLIRAVHYLQRVEGLAASEALDFLQLNQRLYSAATAADTRDNPATEDEE